MIYEALMVPTERPVSLRELKRMLMTYDRVILSDPGDREMMPRNAFMSSIMGLPLFGMDTGPVRPLGKVGGYDEQFSRVLEEARSAVEADILEVRSTFQAQNQGMTIGAVQTGGYPLDTRVVLWLYRSMAHDQGFLREALANEGKGLLRESTDAATLALEGGADGKINDQPALPLIDHPTADAEELEFLSRIARGRVAAFIKYTGYCEAKDLIPVLPAETYGRLATQLLNNAREVVQSADEDSFWQVRSRILQLSHEEFLLDSRLEDLSVTDVIRLRTSAWGRQAEARERLFESVFHLAQELRGKDRFDEAVRNEIQEYRRQSEDLLREREKIGFEIKCDVASGTLGGGAVLTGLLSQLGSPLGSVGVTLAAGGVWALERAKEHVPKLREIRSREEDMKRGAGFGFHDFYSRLH